MQYLLSLPRRLGHRVLGFIDELGAISILIADTVTGLFTQKQRWRLILKHMHEFGVASQPVILVAGGFTGMVFAAQIFWQLNKVQLANGVGSIVSVAMCREMGPLICSLMMTGRIGAAITAEIGTMKVTEQIDALRALATLPVDYLVVPRIVAIMICMPILTAQAIAMGILCSFLLCTKVLGIDPVWYWANTVKYTDVGDIRTGLVKGFVFGLIIVIICCFKGLTCREGAEGVGRATTEAVVVTSITAIVANFFITFLLNAIFPVG